MAAVAKALDLKSWQAVQQWEHDRAKPSRENLDKLASLYGVPMEYLLHGKVLPRSRPARLGPSEAALRLAAQFDMLPHARQQIILGLMAELGGDPAETTPGTLDALPAR